MKEDGELAATYQKLSYIIHTYALERPRICRSTKLFPVPVEVFSVSNSILSKPIWMLLVNTEAFLVTPHQSIWKCGR